MKAVMLGHDAIRAGSSAVVVAGGMESMTNSPYLLPKARGWPAHGPRPGAGPHVLGRPAEPLRPADDGRVRRDVRRQVRLHAGRPGRLRPRLGRARPARRSRRAISSTRSCPVTVSTRKGDHVCAEDEEPHRCNLGKIPTLRPAFKKDGTVTAANASKISDGAAATVLMTAAEAERRGLRAAGPHRRPRHLRARTGMVHHRALHRHRQRGRKSRLVDGRRRPVRDQRGLRLGDHGGDGRQRPRSRQGQRQRRRLRTGPPDRRIRARASWSRWYMRCANAD